MDQPQSFEQLEKKLLDEHHDQYLAFTRLILTLSVGSFSLLTAFNSALLSSGRQIWFAKYTLPLLFLSILSGFFVQQQVMHRPLKDLYLARKLTQAARKNGAEPEPISLRRIPGFLERSFYKLQVISFIFAFCLLATYGYLLQQ